MTKRFTAALFVVLVGFMATGCASGGYLGNNPYPGPLGQVMAGNLAMTCPGDYFVGPPINRCLRSLGGNIGRYSSYPMYAGGMGGVQLSSADKLAVFCGLGGSGLAALLDAGMKKVVGAGLLSAASCEVAGALLSRRGGKNQSVAVMPPSQGQDGYGGPDGIPSAAGNRSNRQEREGPVSNPPSTAGEWRVSNRTSKRVELWDGNQFIARIEPWQSVQVPAPERGYKAVLLIPNRSGGLDQEAAKIRSSNDFNRRENLFPPPH